jgi:hypothetical protein
MMLRSTECVKVKSGLGGEYNTDSTDIKQQTPDSNHDRSEQGDREIVYT